MQHRTTYIPRFRISLVRETRGTYTEQKLSSSADADRLLRADVLVVLDEVDQAFLKTHRILPLELLPDRLVVACSDAFVAAGRLARDARRVTGSSGGRRRTGSGHRTGRRRGAGRRRGPGALVALRAAGAMTFKAVLLVLALMLLAGMIGRRFAPRAGRRDKPAVEAAQKCPTCGAYTLAGAPCERAGCARR